MAHAYHPVDGKLRDEELTRLLGTLRNDVERTVGFLPERASRVARYQGAARAQAA